MREAALITGGAQRIGKEIAIVLAILGFDIALHYHRSAAEAKKTARHIRSYDARCEIFQCDLSREKEASGLMARVRKKFPHLRLLINSASVFEPSRLASGNLKVFHRHFDTNFKAPYILSSQFARLCRRGQIINILDTNITKTKTAHADYLLSKKCLAELTKLAAIQFAPLVRVNGIAPGLILPPKNNTDAYLDRLAQKIPLKTKGHPSQIAQTVQFLIENGYLTGQIIFVDGGEHLL